MPTRIETSPSTLQRWYWWSWAAVDLLCILTILCVTFDKCDIHVVGDDKVYGMVSHLFRRDDVPTIHLMLSEHTLLRTSSVWYMVYGMIRYNTVRHPWYCIVRYRTIPSPTIRYHTYGITSLSTRRCTIHLMLSEHILLRAFFVWYLWCMVWYDTIPYDTDRLVWCGFVSLSTRDVWYRTISYDMISYHTIWTIRYLMCTIHICNSLPSAIKKQ